MLMFVTFSDHFLLREEEIRVPPLATICSEAQKGSILRGYAFTDGTLRNAVRINSHEPCVTDTGLSHVSTFSISS